MRATLLGLLVIGCALPGAECGWVQHSGFHEPAPPAGRCARVRLVSKEGHLVRAPGDGCSADSATACIILMPGDQAEAYSPSDADNMFGTLSGERQNADLVDGSCPLTCE